MAKFAPGVSGNPAGKPKGALNKRTRALMELLDDNAEKITQKMVDAALGGDITACRYILDHILPKDRQITIDLTGANSPAAVMSTVLLAVAAGEIAPSEADAVSKVVSAYGKAIELDELSERVRKLEEKVTQ